MRRARAAEQPGTWVTVLTGDMLSFALRGRHLQTAPAPPICLPERRPHVPAARRHHPASSRQGRGVAPIKNGLGSARANWSHLLQIQEETWNGDRVSFAVSALGQHAAGVLEVRERDVELQVTLPWLLHPVPKTPS